MYGVKDSNSAAHVSTRLNTGEMCALARRWRTAAGVVFHICASCSSLVPMRLPSRSKSSGTVSTVTEASLRLTAMISCNCSMNHGSIFVSSTASFAEIPRSRATSSQWMRSGRGVAIFSRSKRYGRVGRRAPRRTRLERPDAFLQCFLKRAPDGHDFADGLHLRAERRIRPVKLLKLPFRNFGDHVVDRGLETRRRSLRNIVGNFVERHSRPRAAPRFSRSESQ